jgi:hypothetical protein
MHLRFDDWRLSINAHVNSLCFFPLYHCYNGACASKPFMIPSPCNLCNITRTSSLPPTANTLQTIDLLINRALRHWICQMPKAL